MPNGYIRFEKCMSLARLVSQILAYKDTVVSGCSPQHLLDYQQLGYAVVSVHALLLLLLPSLLFPSAL